jgi:hypothetical protein
LLGQSIALYSQHGIQANQKGETKEYKHRRYAKQRSSPVTAILTLGGDLEIQQKYSQLQSELQSLAQKIGELESEAEEHE